MNKKITSAILAALMVAGLTSSKAFADMDNGTVVIGNKAFALAYANNPAHSREIINAIVAGGAVYVKDFQGDWIDNVDGEIVHSSIIPAVTYKDAEGKETKFNSGDDAVVIDKSVKATAVKAISNTKVQVDLQESVEDVWIDSFKITEKNTGRTLEIENAILESDKVVVLETEAMVAGRAYKLVANKEMNFTGIAAEKTAPKLVSVKCTDTNEVIVEFDKALDYISATNIDNYKIDNSAIVVQSSLDTSRKIVKLRTEGVSKNKMYKINIKNIFGIDGAKATSFTRDFVGKEDKIPPTAGKASPVATTNNRIKLTFNDEHGVDKESAENIENYLIKTSTTELEIISIKALDENKDGYYEAVEILTETQNPGKKYEISVSNLTDASVLRNVVRKPLIFTFYGRVTDRQAPEVDRASVKSLNDTTVTLTFNESNALDLSTVLDTSNYEFNGDLEAISIKLINDKDLYSSDAKTVLITTTEQTKGRTYTLTVKNIADEYGNYIKPIIKDTYPKYYFNALGADSTAPYVTSIVSVDNTTVNITFNEDITKASAQDPTNYTIASSRNDLGTAVKAELRADRRTVKLTTLMQEANERYTVTITGITDIVGNTAEDATAKFIAKKVTADTEKPTILYASQLNKDEIWIYFSEAVIYNDSLSTNVLKASANGIDNTNFVKLSYVDSIEEDTVLVFKPSVTYPAKVNEGTTVYLNDFTANFIRDYSGNVVDYRGQSSDIYNRTQFVYYNIASNEAPEVVDYEQVNAKTIRVSFNERVKVTGSVPTILGTAHVSSDNTYIDFVSSSNYNYNNPFKVNFHNIVSDMAGMKARDVNTEICPWMYDTDKPEVLNVYAVDNSTVKIEFSKELGSKWIAPQVGSYRLYKLNSYDRKVYLTGTPKTCGEGAYEYVNFIVTSELLKGDTTYYLEVIGGARDIAGNYMEIRGLEPYIFQGTDKVDNKVEDGIEIINSNTFRLVDETITSATLRVKDSNAPNGWISVGTLAGVPQMGSSYALEFKSPIALVEAQTYEVSYKNVLGKLCSYQFNGIAINPVIRVLVDRYGLAKIDYSGIDTQSQTIKAYKLIKEFNGYDSKLTPLTIIGSDTEMQYAYGLNAGDIVYVVIEDKIGGNVIYAGSAEVYSTSEDYDVVDNYVPVVIAPIADKIIEDISRDYVVDLNTVFYDEDKDKLIYTATSSDTSKVEITVNESILIIYPKKAGDSTIRITAQDGRGGSVSTEFKVIIIAADTTLPKASIVPATLVVGEDVTTARSSELGAIYLVNAAITPKNLAELEELVNIAVTPKTIEEFQELENISATPRTLEQLKYLADLDIANKETVRIAKKVPVIKVDEDTKISTKDLVPGNYVVYAVDVAGNMSLPSEGQIKLQVEPIPVKGVKAEARNLRLFHDGLEVWLTWDQNKAINIKGYEIYRTTNPNGITDAVAIDELVPFKTYVDIDVEEGETYYYTVYAVDNMGNKSAISNIARVTVE